jgi:hypothetical protein
LKILLRRIGGDGPTWIAPEREDLRPTRERARIERALKGANR